MTVKRRRTYLKARVKEPSSVLGLAMNAEAIFDMRLPLALRFFLVACGLYAFFKEG